MNHATPLLTLTLVCVISFVISLSLLFVPALVKGQI